MTTFEICTAVNGQYYFHLKSLADKRILLRSELYTVKSSCRNGIDSVKKNAGDDAKFKRMVAVNGQHYFNLKAGNGEVIGTSKMYADIAEVEADIALVKTKAPVASIVDIA